MPDKKGSQPRRQESIRGAYYRKPDGYITYGDGPETAQAKALMGSGFELLLEYSWTDKTRSDGSPLRISYEEDEHPNVYYWFIKNGGAPLFPVKQLLELGWDVKPPYGLPVEAFPQLEGNMPKRWMCRICGPDRIGYISEQNLRAHLRVGHQLRMNEVADEIKDLKKEREAEASAE